MVSEKIKEKISIICFVGFLQFIVLTFIAFFFYTGGTVWDPTSPGYSFFYNFFSDLGMINSYSGAPNTIAAVIFFIAIMVFGLSTIILFIIFPFTFIEDLKLKIVSIIGSVFGVLCGIMSIGVAFTPGDILPNEHNIFAAYFYLFAFFAAVIYSLAFLLSKEYSNINALVWLIFGVTDFIYCSWILANMVVTGPEILFGQAGGQKLMIYLWVISYILTSYNMWKLSKR